MEKIKAFSLSREVIIASALTGGAVLAPLLHSQLVTGSIVNAALFVAALTVSFKTAFAVAVVPSLIALASGSLPAPLAAMVPFIMMSNIALVGVFKLLRPAGYWIAAMIAAVIKFSLLVISANAILVAVTHGKISLALASMMGWPQLITALAGALIAAVFLERRSVR